MAIFCTQCGVRNDEGAAFCEGCGTALRKPATVTAPSISAADPIKVRTNVLSKKVLYAGAAVGGVLLLAGIGLYFALTPPAATSSTLLAAAKAGYEKSLTGQYKNELCLSNMNYGLANFNVAEHDQGTQTWLNLLVSAGLFSPAVAVNSGGFFPQNLMQYAATPELAKWREGARLCVGKGIEVAEVIDIEKPQEEILGRQAQGEPSKVLTVKAKLVLQATGTPPWLEKGDIRAAVLEKMSGWESKNATLQKQTPDVFGLREGKWTTGPAYKTELQKQSWNNQRASQSDENTGSAGKHKVSSDLSAILSKLFSFGGHPMMGTWRVVSNGLWTNKVPLVFTSDTCNVQGVVTKCKFEVDGNQVTITSEGESNSLVFTLQDKTTAILDTGFGKGVFKRVD